MSAQEQQKRATAWHEGELELQTRAGVVARLDEVGRSFIRDFMPQQHRDFYARLPFIIIGAVDQRAQAWATLRASSPGFISSPDEHTLRLEIEDVEEDPADEGLKRGDSVGLLGIDLGTRRRNRINGLIASRAEGALHVKVEHSFGNCPKYIQQREIELGPTQGPAPASIESSEQLTARARAIIEQADTFFVASYVDRPSGRQVDVSHRGGRPGFIKIEADGALLIPDFAGNNFFNTLGNFVINPRAGLLFVDFETGDILQLSGEAELLWDMLPEATLKGALRFWRFRAKAMLWRARASPWRWRFTQWSEHSLRTGEWARP